MPARIVAYRDHLKQIGAAAGGGAAGRRGDAARSPDAPQEPDRQRLLELQAGNGPPPHPPPHDRRQRADARALRRLAAGAAGRSGGADEGPADQRHPLLPRCRGLLGPPGARRAAALRRQGSERSGQGLGSGLRHRRGGLLDCDAARRAPRPRRRAAAGTALRHRPRRGRDCQRPQRVLQHRRRRRRPPGAARSLLPSRVGGLSCPPRSARDDPVRAPQPGQGSAVLPPRPDLVPQPADLRQSRGAGAHRRNLPFRAAAARLPAARAVGVTRAIERAVPAARPDPSFLPEPPGQHPAGPAGASRHDPAAAAARGRPAPGRSASRRSTSTTGCSRSTRRPRWS